MLVDELLLPVGEDDRAQVLAPRPVLREQARPVHPVALAVAASWSANAADPIAAHTGKATVDLAGNLRVGAGTRDSGAPALGRRDEVAVAEVLAEQIGVVGGERSIKIAGLASPTSARHGCARRLGKPTVHRPHGQPRARGNRAQRLTRRSSAEHVGAYLGTMHAGHVRAGLRQFRAPGGIRTHKPFGNGF